MRARGSESIERCVAELRNELRSLERTVDDLDKRLAAMESSESSVQPDGAQRIEFEDSASLWSWVGQSRFLPRIAIVCFVLVLALILRTLTESGSIQLGLGVVLGMVYSAGLIAWGWVGLARRRRGGTVFPACGAVLMCTVVLEAHGSFQLLTAAQANSILLGTLAVLTLLGLSYRIAAVVAFGVLPPAVSALILGFPNPEFAYTAAVLFGANFAALLCAHRRNLVWLSFSTFALTLFFWLFWGFKTNAALRSQDAVPAALASDWFLPCLIAFATLFVAVAAVRAFAHPRSPGVFHVLAPTLNVAWAYPTALAIVAPSMGQATALGITGVIVAGAHFGIAAVLWSRIRQCAAGITSFAVAGTVLLTIAVVSATGDLVFALPIWAAVALGLGVFSAVCGNPSLRALGYVLQGLACVFAAAGSTFGVPSASPALAITAAAALTAISAAHFRWTHAHLPPEESWLARFDPNGRHAIGLLWFAAINAFLLLRLLAYPGIEAAGVDLENTFRCTQSVIINGASIALMWWGLRARDKDILGTAVAVAAIGGLRVFVSDLQNSSGIPLVIAVFSFGLAAAFGSVVLGKWQAATVDSAPTDDGSP